MTEILQNSSETKDVLIKKKEQEIFEKEFIKTGEINKYPEAHVKYIKENVYGVYYKKNGILCYDDNNGTLIYSPGGMSENPYFDDAMKNTGYVLKQDSSGVYNLYKIDSGGKVADIPVSKYSIDFFNFWKNIDFFSIRSLSKIPQNKRLSREQFLEMLPEYIKSEFFRIKDLMEFHGRKQIDKDNFIKYLPAFEDLLKKQCNPNSDLIKNFEKVDDPLTEKEIEGYYKNREIFENKGLISRETAEICIVGIRKRDGEKKINQNAAEKLKE